MTKKAVRSIAMILLFCIVLTSAPFTAGAAVREVAPAVLINQVYGAGNRAGAISHSFIELYNPSDQAVDLNEYSVQLSNGGGWYVLPLTGETIAARSSFLIVCTTPPPNEGEADSRYVITYFDLEWGQEISNRNFSVALVRNQTPLPLQLPHDINAPQMQTLGVVDLMGAVNDPRTDTIANFLGQGHVTPISRQRAARRVYFANTGDNSADFTTHDFRTTGITDQQLAQLRPRSSRDGEWEQTPQGPPDRPPHRPGVVINQMQGSGGRTGALSHSFIELYNSSDEAVDLDEWSVQLLNQPRGGAPDGWHVLPLAGHVIAPHTSFLIVNPTGPPNAGEDPPRVVFTQWDIQWDNREISNHNFSVALVNNRTALPTTPLPHDLSDPLMASLGVVDLVGAFNEPQDRDANNHFLGQAPAGRNTRQQAVRRTYFQNTGDNSADFRSVDYAYPRGISDEEVARLRPRSSHDGPWGQTRREITFSHEAGIYADPFTLTLNTGYEGAVIRFTTDGSEPTAASPVFPMAGLQIQENTAVPTAPPFQTYEPNHTPITPVPFDHFNPRPNLSHVLRVRDQHNVIRSVGNNLDMGEVHRPNTPVFMGTALRVRLFAEDGSVLSPTETRSFFVNAEYAELPIVAVTTDPGTLFAPDGLNFWSVGGIGLGINRRVYSRNAGGRGHAWEREGHLELIEPDGTVGISQQIGLRINGNQTRELAKRAWRIYARGEQSTFQYDIFQGRARNYRHEPIHEFGRFIMRASGQDGRWAMVRDAMIQHMAIGTHAPGQAHRASAFFINGEFWGIYNIRERTDDQTYMRQNEFGSTDNVGEIGFSHSANNIPDAMRFERPEDREDKDYVDLAMYMQMWNWFNRNTPQVQEERLTYTWLQEAQRFLCLDNFIDNYIFNMFVSNTDWPGNNIELFRYSPPAYFATDLSSGFPFPTLADIQQGNLPDNNRDGRWRWHLKDLDYGMAAPRRFHMSRNMFEWLTVPSSDAVQAPWSTMMWRRFMDNPYFRAKYTNRLTDLMNTNLRKEVFHAEINRMAGDIAPAIPQEAGRWRVFTANQWANNIQTIRNFADIRQENMMNHARVAMNEGGFRVSLNLGAAVTLTLRSEGEMGFFRLNGMDIEEGKTPGVANQEEWTGLYFANTVQTIEAVEYPGFAFSHFIVNGVIQPTGEDTLELLLTGDTTVEVIFQDSGAFVPVHEIIGVPASKAAEIDLSLADGEAIPQRATNRDVVWSIADAGTTGATLVDGNILRTTAPGTVVLTATVRNGLTATTDFVQDFPIQVLPFTPVQNIVGVPDRVIVNAPAALGGIVMPANATMQTITWAVADAGTTGATIVGNTLTATAPGLITVRATVTQGHAITADYERVFFVRADAAGDAAALEALLALASPIQDRRLFVAGYDEFFVAKVDAEVAVGGYSTQAELDLAYQNLHATWSRLQPQPGGLAATPNREDRPNVALAAGIADVSHLRPGRYDDVHTINDGIHVGNYTGGRSGQRWTTFGNNSASEWVTYVWPAGARIDGTNISFTVDGEPPGSGGLRYPASYAFHYLPLGGDPDNPAAWLPLGTVTSGITADMMEGNYTAFAAPVEAWQLRVTVQKQAQDSNGIGVWEWEVYGSLLEYTPTVPDTYPLTVQGGSGSGSFVPGAVVDIMAEVPAGKLFVAWEAAGVQIASRYCVNTSVIMPPGAATITARFELEDNRAHQEAPTGLVGHPTSFANVNDGHITGVDETMEWAPDPDGPWTEVTGDTVTSLAPGRYYIRRAETKTHFASPATLVTIAAGTGLAPTAEIGVAVAGDAVTVDVKPPIDGSDIAVQAGKIVITLPDTEGDGVVVNLPARPADVAPEDWWHYTVDEDDGTATITITPPDGYEVVAYPEDSGAFRLRQIVPPLTLILTPTEVTITDTATSATVTVTGTATGDVKLDTDSLPMGVTAELDDAGNILITGVRPTTENGSIIGTFDLAVTRQGVSKTVEVAVNLTTTWTPVVPGPHAVKWELDGGRWPDDTPPPAETVAHGATILAPTATPIRTGYTFAGWDRTFPITNVTGDIELTAQWKADQGGVPVYVYFTVRFHLANGIHTGGGGLVQEVREGEGAIAPEVTRMGYTFVRWDRAFTNVTDDLTVTAIWARIVVEPEPNRAGLRDLLAAASELETQGVYSDTSWTALVTARAAAQTVYDDEAATQAQINAAEAALGEAIEGLREFHRAYMFGNSAGAFRPTASITRAEVAAILARTMIDEFDSDADVYDLPAGIDSFDTFHDVASSDWFYYYVAWVSYEGLVLGDDRGNFRPTDPISRQELAMMIARLDGIAETAGDMPFGDVAEIAGWARTAVYTVYRDDRMQGDNRGNFRPRANITRAEVATVINRILGRLDSREAYEAAKVERDNARVFPDIPMDRDPIQWYLPSVLAATNDHYLTRDESGTIDWKFVSEQPQRGS